MSKSRISDDYDVLVVGAGPSGLTTAVALARLGVRVLVIEKHPGLSIFPKAIGVRPRSMEIFRSWGLEPEIRRRSQRGRVEMSVQPTLGDARAGGQPRTAGSPRWWRRSRRRRSPSCGQDQLEAVLHDHLLARGGEVRFRTELVAITQTADGVRAVIRHRDTDESSVVTARYLVGADGARSLVRSLIGIEFEVLGTEADHLSVLFTGDLSAVMPDPPYILNVTVAPGVEGLFASTAMPHRWIYDMEWHPETGERIEDWTPERITARLRGAAGLPDLQPEIVGVFPWDFGAGVAPELSPRSGAAGRRRRPPDHAAGRHRHEHRDRRRAQPGLETRLGDQGLGGRAPARLLRGRTRTGRPRQRRRVAGHHDQPPGRPDATGWPTTSGSPTTRAPSSGAPRWPASAPRTPGSSRAAKRRLHDRPLRRPVHLDHRRGRLGLAGGGRRAGRRRACRSRC